MITSRFSISIQGPAEKVWERVIDYAGYATLPGVQSARVVELGKEHPAGVGALRELKIDGLTFLERIVEFEPPRSLAYRIVESKPLPLVHEIGRMTLTERAGVTELTWATTYTIGVPLVGDLLARLISIPMGRTFRKGLAVLREQVESAAGAA